MTVSAWVIITSDWSSFLCIKDGTDVYSCDFTNLTMGATGNINPFSGSGSLVGTHLWNDLIQTSWVYVTCVIDSSAGTISYYDNGDPMITYTGLSTQTATMISKAKAGTMIFGDMNWSDPAVKMDDVSVFNGALSAADVATLYGQVN
jgi:hypothetical protein